MIRLTKNYDNKRVRRILQLCIICIRYMKKLKKNVIFFIINHFLCVTRFFKLKRYLLEKADCQIGKNSKIVGPVYIGNMAELNMFNRKS